MALDGSPSSASVVARPRTAFQVRRSCVSGVRFRIWSCDDPAVSGLIFCRCRMLLVDGHVTPEGGFTTPDGEPLLRRLDYSQFWIHQYLRVRVLRAEGEKCPRCWLVRRLGEDARHPELCARCAAVVA